MDVYDRVLGLHNKRVVYRPIEFERYRKPQVVEYPRHATVLNPLHTRLQKKGERERESSSSEDEAEKDKSDAESEDDDDPKRFDPADQICSNAQLKQSLHLRWQQVGPVGIGLENIGNTCFANSVLQCIAYTPALAQYFASSFKAADTQLGAPYDFAYALGEVVRQVHLRKSGSGSGGAYRPGIILGHLRALSSHLKLGRQCDAHEFAVQLLHGCQKSILFRQFGSKKIQPRVAQTTTLYRICGGYLRSQVSWDVREEIQQLKREGKKQAAIDLRLIWENKRQKAPQREDIVHHKMHSNTYDPFTIINVDITGKTLYHCLDLFCKEETLEGRIYQTPREVKVQATKRFHIYCAPPVLMIQLKRFTPTGGKNSKFIQYPDKLDIARYCISPTGSTLYELNAICVHEGSSLSYGHYYAVVRARNKVWYECNDERISTVSAERAAHQQAFLLFYSRVDTERKERVRKTTTESTSTPLAPQTAPVAIDIGREITEEELAQRRTQKERRPSPRHSPRSSTTTTPTLGPLKRPRKEVEESSDDDSDCGGFPTGEDDPTRLTAKPQVDEGGTEASVPPARPTGMARYGGIVRALKRHDTSQLSTSGRRAVFALRKHKEQSTPATVARPATAPKFQQKIKDVLWEMEMDKGKVKKVKKKPEGETRMGNIFQKEAEKNSFDVRGRRQR